MTSVVSTNLHFLSRLPRETNFWDGEKAAASCKAAASMISYL